MVTYNQASYVAQAIESVLRQRTGFPFELVIGEDCSTDGTRQIVDRFAREFPGVIRVVTSDRNVGIARNYYRTEKACRGKYVAYCEGDDCWQHPGKIEKQVSLLESHPECGLVYSDYDLYYLASGRRIGQFNKQSGRAVSQNPTFQDVMEGRSGILTCTVMVRRHVLERVVDSDPALYQNETLPVMDTPRWAEISYLTTVFRLEESMATHNLLAESVSQSRNKAKKLRYDIAGTEVMLYLCDKYAVSSGTREIHQAEWYRLCLSQALYERNAEQADAIRRRKGRMTMAEWLKCSAAKHWMVNYALRGVVHCRDSLLRGREVLAPVTTGWKDRTRTARRVRDDAPVPAVAGTPVLTAFRHDGVTMHDKGLS
jgi:glycosyltransferase involved in cell wall biosynthesis